MTLLSLDLSTTCTGYAFFEIETKKLHHTGIIKPKVKGVTKLKPPKKQLEKMINIATQIRTLIKNLNPDKIVIEEVSGSSFRKSQKVLDSLHYILLYFIMDIFDIETIVFYDVTGANGWRNHLKLKLLDSDKQKNKESRQLNKSLPNNQKLPIIGPKHLACRHANYYYNLDLDVDKRSSDGDIADAVSMGDSAIKFIFTRK